MVGMLGGINMKRSYTLLNIFCLLLIGGALFGTAWFSRGYIRNLISDRKNADIPIAISRVEMEKKSEVKIPVLPTQVTSSVPVNDIPSSTPQVSSTPIQAEKPIPPEINLDVPFVPQAPEKNWDQPWQDACEEAAILMMDAYYKDIVTSVGYDKEQILKMVTWEEDRNWGLSIEIEKIQQIFTEYLKLPTGHTTKIIENPTINQIKKYVANAQPVYVVADGKTLPNPHFQNGGPEYHALVIRGYTKDSFITNDPGTQFGQNFKYKYNDLMDAIHDWNGGDVVGGRPVVLVIE